MVTSDEDTAAMITLAAEIIAADLADDRLVRFILGWTYADSESIRLAYALAAKRGDTLRVAPDDPRLLYKLSLLALLV